MSHRKQHIVSDISSKKNECKNSETCSLLLTASGEWNEIYEKKKIKFILVYWFTKNWLRENIEPLKYVFMAHKSLY